jgi:C1A family cysteine protease
MDKFKDEKFTRFVATVSPRVNGKQPVLLTELQIVLELLWQIYRFFKNKNVVTRYLLSKQVTKAMTTNVLVSEKERALAKILKDLEAPKAWFQLVCVLMLTLCQLSAASEYRAIGSVEDIEIHPEMRLAIERNEKLPTVDGSEDFVMQDGVKRFTGFRPTRTFYQNVIALNFKADPAIEVPLEFDYRKFSFSPVRRQRRGSCWAQGNCSAFEFNTNAVLKTKFQFSVEDIIQCSGFGTAGRGGQLSMEYNLKAGLAFEKDYPMKEQDIACRKTVQRQYPMKKVGILRGASGGLPNTLELKQAILKYGTVEVCGSSASLGRGGRQDQPRSGRVDHCYTFAGWLDGVTQGWLPGTYWINKNSWGDGDQSNPLSAGADGWGDGGYGYHRLAGDDTSDTAKLKGSTAAEIQFGFSGELLPLEPINFTVETASTVSKVRIETSEPFWSKESLSAAIQQAYDAADEAAKMAVKK